MGIRAIDTLAVSILLLATALFAQQPDELHNLSLEELLQTRVTSATRIEEPARTAPATIYVITAEEIRRLGLRDLKDILAIVPGIDTTDPHFFLLGGQRGFVGSFSQSLLLIDGREVNNLIAGETFISNQFRAGNIKQVEIINGPGSAVYGANALGGVINIITHTQTGFHGFESTVEYGSFQTGEGHALFGWDHPGWKLQGSVDLYTSNGEDFSEFLSDTAKASPAAENNPYRRLPVDFGYNNDSDAETLDLRGESGNFYGGEDFYRNVSGRGTSGIQWDYTKGSDHRDLSLSFLGYQRDFLQERAHWKAEYRYYWEQFWGNHTETEGPLVNPETGEIVTTGATLADVEAFRGFYSNKNGGGSNKHVLLFESKFSPEKHQTLLGGIQYENSDVVGAAFSRTEGEHPAIGPDQTRPEFSNYKWSFYLEDQARLIGDALIATAGLRYDKHERYGGDLSPRIGLVGTLHRTTVKVLYGEAFREPNVFEIQNSSGSIRPTSLRTIEAGWQQYVSNRFKNEIVFYKNIATDLIVTDAIAIGGISNKGEFKSRGLEDVFDFQLSDHLRGFLNYSYTTGDLKEPDKGMHDVYDIAPHKGNLALMGELGRYSIGALIRSRSSVLTEYHNALYRVPSYAAVDITFGTSGIPWMGSHPNTGIDVIIKNVFNTHYFQPEPRAPSVVEHPQDGFDISVRLTFHP